MNELSISRYPTTRSHEEALERLGGTDAVAVTSEVRRYDMESPRQEIGNFVPRGVRECGGVQQEHGQDVPLAEPSVDACPLLPQQHGQPED